jgi:Sensors of blue-light using FAD
VNQERSGLGLLVYASAASAPFSSEALSTLLQKARHNNARSGLTDMLLYHQDSFFQALEGSSAATEAAFARISLDPRHTRILKLIQELIDERSFSDWTMGLGRVDREQLGEIPGLNDFFKAGSHYWELGEGRAHTLLGAFREGRWRQTLSE